MSYNRPKPLSELLDEFIEEYPYRKELKRGMIKAEWASVVGQKIAEQTKALYFKESKLFVHVPNPAWRHEIHMQRFHIAQKLNRKVKEKIVSEIVVRS